MGIRLSFEEAWAFLESGHTGLFTTLRRDGWPVSLPVWYAALDGALYLRTPMRARKVGRVRRDARCCFAVESGLAWKELKGVVVTGRASLVQAPDEQRRALEAIDAKYERFRTAAAAMPRAAQAHYADMAVIRVDPVGGFLSWDNAKLRLRPGG